jgi:DNA-binding SARP family transcriptional activator/tetratricopeptide (TPR) repeat protein
VLCVRFCVLGPVEVHTGDGRVLTLPRRHERCLLAILLLEAGRAVPTDRLCELLWDDNPPQHARQTLRTYVARVRGLLADAGAAEHGITLTAHHNRYLLKVDPETVDAHRFRRLVATAATADLPERERLLHKALTLWRGPALDRAATDQVRQRLCADLDELRLQAQEQSLAAEIDLGRHQQLLPDLARLCAEHPTRQRLTELHMLALYRAERTADALDIYQHTRDRLADSLGVDPDPALQRLHTTILRGEPAPAAATPINDVHVPAQLPADLASFAGRTDQLKQLDALLPTTTAVVITAIDGTAGVGKTALAVHWAHRVADRFPDGQLYANLRGFDPSGAPVSPYDVVRRFLDALGVPARRIPHDVEAQINLYRSELADKHVLVVLDNARDTAQVRPLLPGAPSCLTLVTSRKPLTGLVAVYGARPIQLDVLTEDESRQLLAARLGGDRLAAEPEVVDDIVAGCARLPLALAIAAARAATEPGLSLTALTAQLRDAQRRLDALTGDDAATDIRAVFDCSYRALSADAARLLRQLGQYPGDDITAPAAASLAAVRPDQVEPLLAELTNANLVTQHSAGRYTCHDLLRGFAIERSHAEDSAQERHDTLDRILDHLAQTAHAAVPLVDASRRSIAIAPPRPGVSPERLTNHAEAVAWFRVEHHTLLAVTEHAADHGLDHHTWPLAWAIGSSATMHGQWRDQITAYHAAVRSLRRLGDRDSEAQAHTDLCLAYTILGQYSDAETQIREALRLADEVTDRSVIAHLHRAACHLYSRQARHREAADHGRRAVAIARAIGERTELARALNTLGWDLIQIGDNQEALVHCREALRLHQELHDPRGEAAALDSLGYAYHHLGEHDQAADCYRQALRLCRALSNRWNEATVLVHLGENHEAAGDHSAAQATWRMALAVMTEIEHPGADAVRARLLSLNGVHTP